ncbi:ABC transporter permease [Patescibacteria group bacterium]
MNILLTIKIAIRGLLVNKMRAFLTILGTIIGVSGIIVIVSVGNGAESLIVSQIESIGTNIVGVLPGGGDEDEPPAALFGIVVTTLNNDDIYSLKEIPHIESVSGYNREVMQIVYKNRKTEATVNGVFPEYPLVVDAVLKEGRFFTTSEDASLSKVVVIGHEVKQTLFGDGNAIGEKIKIRNHSFKIIGCFHQRGTIGFVNADSHIYIPSQTMQKLILGINHIAMARIKVDDAKNVPNVISSIKDILRARHGIDNPADDDFSVQSQSQGLETISNVTGSIKMFLTAIAAIALIVGGIGIMNVMYISVTERTHEIGLRKALGAQQNDILKQFLVEAVAITGLGGLIGIILGFIVSCLISIVINQLGFSWECIVTIDSVVIASMVIVGIGVIFGYAPASKASKKRAIEALRYE